jgi:hypothetical protein
MNACSVFGGWLLASILCWLGQPRPNLGRLGPAIAILFPSTRGRCVFRAWCIDNSAAGKVQANGIDAWPSFVHEIRPVLVDGPP